MMEETGETEKKRIEAQREKLGEQGLKEKQEALEKATEENEVRLIYRMV